MRERLAIDGGTPVRSQLLPYGKQTINESDVEAVTAVLRSDWLTTGPTIQKFEESFAAFVAARHAVTVSSGTAALHVASWAAGVGPDDEVVVPALTFAASANCARYLGARVVFADVRGDTLCLDPGHVASLITPRTKAIVTVDFGGQPSDLDELLALADRHGLVVIEDAAHAVGATYRGRAVGSIAHLSTFSFHPVKQMTTGEGGAVVTQDAKLAERARVFRNHGISSDARKREQVGSWFYEMADLGFNYRLTDVQCALGLSQLRQLPAWLARRVQIAQRYTAAFAPMTEVEPLAQLPDRRSAWHLYVVRFNLEHLAVDRARIFAALRAENIGVNVHYIPVPWHPYYQKIGYARGEWPVAESNYERIVTLPLWAGMSDSDADDVIRAVEKVCEAYRQ